MSKVDYYKAEYQRTLRDLTKNPSVWKSFLSSAAYQYKYTFLIHDFFFAKTLDKVRPGGVVAFITSSGTLDKASPAVRKYLAERADLISAIRLPDDTFKDNAGTRVVSDIIFLQKRDRVIEREADWIHLATTEDGITMNQYFVDHPDMVLGDMVMRSGPFGEEPTCRAKDGVDLADALKDAVAKIHAEIQDVERDELTEEKNDTIPADPRVKNYSYTLVDGKIYYRHNSIMRPVETYHYEKRESNYHQTHKSRF